LVATVVAGVELVDKNWKATSVSWGLFWTAITATISIEDDEMFKVVATLDKNRVGLKSAGATETTTIMLAPPLGFKTIEQSAPENPVLQMHATPEHTPCGGVPVVQAAGQSGGGPMLTFAQLNQVFAPFVPIPLSWRDAPAIATFGSVTLIVIVLAALPTALMTYWNPETRTFEA